MVEEISIGYIFFWVPFVVFINFAVMRVVAALFIKQTLAVAASDEEKMAIDAMKMREEFAAKLMSIFEEADVSGDGLLDPHEFSRMLSHDHVIELFGSLQLEFDEVVALYQVVAGVN